ncbi:MAG: hypothetical protein RIB45_16400 [Marivibrio sp.]|uniref:hypothetical protein n=1 Tax=Marivibrio sp. TaxID=2039719 RepID=UPI0032EDBA70
MNNASNKPIRSPSYPNMPLRDAVSAVGNIEAQYRASPVDRTEAAKLIGYSSLSGPANKALAALASYGLLERAGKGSARVTERARAILHAANEDEKKENLLAAASEPPLFRELREHFEDVPIPPEGGVITYLNRQGFNPSAIKPAAKAFLETMQYIEELRSSGSRGAPGRHEVDPERSGGESVVGGHGGANVGDLIQWESQGVVQLQTPTRVRHISDDGSWVFVDGSETGIPMEETIVVQKADKPPPPKFPFASVSESSGVEGESEWMRNTLGPETKVRLMVRGEMGPREIKKLIRLLEAQRAVLMEDDDE